MPDYQYVPAGDVFQCTCGSEYFVKPICLTGNKAEHAMTENVYRCLKCGQMWKYTGWGTEDGMFRWDKYYPE